MKKFLTLASLAVIATASFAIKAQNEAEYLAEFIQLKDKHKADWFNYKGSLHQEKYQLLANNHKQWADFKIAANNDWKNLTDVNQKDGIFKKHLEQAVALYEEQTSAWKQYWQNKDTKARELAERHAKELKNFKVKAGLAPAEEEEVEGEKLGEAEELTVFQPASDGNLIEETYTETYEE